MPLYASNAVNAMTTGSAWSRGEGLTSLKSLLADVTDEQVLKLLEEPGMLVALNSFMSSDTRLVVVAISVMERMTSGFTNTNDKCKELIFSSDCFPTLKAISASTVTAPKLKRAVWCVCGERNRERGKNGARVLTMIYKNFV